MLDYGIKFKFNFHLLNVLFLSFRGICRVEERNVFGCIQIFSQFFIQELPFECFGAEQVRWSVISFVSHFRTRMNVESHVIIHKVRMRLRSLTNECNFSQSSKSAKREVHEGRIIKEVNRRETCG